MKKIFILLILALVSGQINAQNVKKTDAAGSVVILLTHPDFEKSKANKALIDAVKDIPQVKIVDLYATPLDVEFYKKTLTEAKAVVFQFPFYWASAPSQLKKWFDEVFISLAGTEAVKGKPAFVATTTGSEYEAYRSGGRNQFTIDELLRPYQVAVNHSGMVWLTPFAVYGTSRPEAEKNIKEGAKEYRKRIEALIK
ncbi:MAG: NAD(P)H-dependent oxidoreductase [Prevotellaceae bacterium]|jgi:glutathione-regulated potassium-efflux system ancillary protein KefG|nr:NAD(P)H-dependent oxidoreductase [Prevotellaceae bacterium]